MLATLATLAATPSATAALEGGGWRQRSITKIWVRRAAHGQARIALAHTTTAGLIDHEGNSALGLDNCATLAGHEVAITCGSLL